MIAIITAAPMPKPINEPELAPPDEVLSVPVNPGFCTASFPFGDATFELLPFDGPVVVVAVVVVLAVELELEP